MSSEMMWFLSRATGIVALVLLTGILVLGMLLSRVRAAHSTAPTIVMALHRWLSLGMIAFLAAHIVTAVAEGFVDIGWLAVVVPFVAGYEPLLIGFGAIAVDLVVAIVVTSLVRHRIPERLWARIHMLAYAMWPLGLVHGYFLGTADQPLLRGVTIACGVVGLASIVWRVLGDNPDAIRRQRTPQESWS